MQPDSPRIVAARLPEHTTRASLMLATSLFVLVAMLAFIQCALAADTSGSSQARAEYEADRAHCNALPADQDRTNCIQSVGAAYEEAKSGRLDTAEHPFTQNQLERCKPLPPDDRADCIRRMEGQGSVSGSVSGGGILRESDTLEVTVPAPETR